VAATVVESAVETVLQWDYAASRPELSRLYEKAKGAQWNASLDLDWSRDVEFGSFMASSRVALGLDDLGSPIGPETVEVFFRELQVWMASQFLHGEQGALLAAARIVETAPEIETKLFAASQVYDEARHVEAYRRYLDEKIGAEHRYGVNAGLDALLGDVLTDSRWDLTYLGMQILVEGLALATFGSAKFLFADALLSDITDAIMRDEARHVSFGVMALDGFYAQLTASELADREDFVVESCRLLHDRFYLGDVWEVIGVDRAGGEEFVRQHPLMAAFRRLLFSQILPNIGKLGLLTPRVDEKLSLIGISR
jgi:hypothetical protein